MVGEYELICSFLNKFLTMHNNQDQSLNFNLIQNHIAIFNDESKRGSLLFSSTGSEIRKETVVIFVALSAVPHLCNALYVRGTSTERCVYRCEHTLLPHSY